MDIAVFFFLSWVFSGTLGGMMVAMVASATVSVSLYFNPPNLEGKNGEN